MAPRWSESLRDALSNQNYSLGSSRTFYQLETTGHYSGLSGMARRCSELLGNVPSCSHRSEEDGQGWGGEGGLGLTTYQWEEIGKRR